MYLVVSVCGSFAPEGTITTTYGSLLPASPQSMLSKFDAAFTVTRSVPSRIAHSGSSSNLRAIGIDSLLCSRGVDPAGHHTRSHVRCPVTVVLPFSVVDFKFNDTGARQAPSVSSSQKGQST